MRFERKQLGKNLIQYRLLGPVNKTERLAMYNDILFSNLNVLTGKYRKSIIILNENTSGGMILSDKFNADTVFKNLRKIYKKYNEVEFVKRKEILSRDKKNVKLVFYAK